MAGLLSSGVLDDPVHFFRVFGLFQGLAELLFVKELGDVCEGVQMFLELSLRDEKEHDQIDGLIVQGVEVDSLG